MRFRSTRSNTLRPWEWSSQICAKMGAWPPKIFGKTAWRSLREIAPSLSTSMHLMKGLIRGEYYSRCYLHQFLVVDSLWGGIERFQSSVEKVFESETEDAISVVFGEHALRKRADGELKKSAQVVVIREFCKRKVSKCESINNSTFFLAKRGELLEFLEDFFSGETSLFSVRFDIDICDVPGQSIFSRFHMRKSIVAG